MALLDAETLKRIEELEEKVKELEKQGERLEVAEDALRQSEEIFLNIIGHSNELFYIYDTEHTLTYVSQASEDLLGYSPEETMIKWTELATDNPINLKGLEITEKGIKISRPSRFDFYR